MLSFRRKKPDSILGIDFGSTSIKILELSGSRDQYCVESYCYTELTDPDAFNKLIRRSNLSSRKTVIAVPDSFAISRIIQIKSSVQEQDFEEWVLMEAEKFLPYRIDDINLDFNRLGPSSNNSELLDVRVVACRSETINQRIETTSRAGLNVQIVDVESYAIERAARTLGDNIAVFDVGQLYIRFLVFNAEGIIFSREESVGQRPSPELLLQLLKRALQFFFSTNHDGKINQIFLSGDSVDLPDLARFFQELLGISTQISNPFQHMTFSTKLIQERIKNDASKLLVACGLALHGLEVSYD